jgi:hypothetical protein
MTWSTGGGIEHGATWDMGHGLLATSGLRAMDYGLWTTGYGTPVRGVAGCGVRGLRRAGFGVLVWGYWWRVE